jgi:hypothetical protein
MEDFKASSTHTLSVPSTPMDKGSPISFSKGPYPKVEWLSAKAEVKEKSRIIRNKHNNIERIP